MNLKEEFHQLIDSIEDENVLKAYYELIQNLNHDADYEAHLTPEQEQLVLRSYNESFDEKNLVPNNQVMEKYSQWLK